MRAPSTSIFPILVVKSSEISAFFIERHTQNSRYFGCLGTNKKKKNMKKIALSLISLIVILILLGSFLLSKKSFLISRFLSSKTNAPVSIEEILFFKGGCKISYFHLQNNTPPCKTSTALSAKEITCIAPLSALFHHKIEIESIHLKDIQLGIEFFTPSGDENNWTLLLSNNKPDTKSSRPYLIRSVIFDNIHVTITDPTGKVKNVPPISHLEFHNISDESGIPIEELQKAIFHSMIESIFKKLGIKTIKKILSPSIIPKLFHLPFGSILNAKEEHPCADGDIYDGMENHALP